MRRQRAVMGGLAIATLLSAASCSRAPTVEERSRSIAKGIAPEPQWYACQADPEPDDCAGYRSEWSAARFNELNTTIRDQFPGRFTTFKLGVRDPADPKKGPPFVLHLKDPMPEDAARANAFAAPDRIEIIAARASEVEKRAVVDAIATARGQEDWARPIINATSKIENDEVEVAMIRASDAQVAEVRRRALPVPLDISNYDELPVDAVSQVLNLG